MSSKKPIKRHLSEESIEAKPRSHSAEPTTFKNEIKALADDATKTLWDEMLKSSVTDVFGQVFGGGEELHEGQEVSLKKQAHKQQETQEEEKQIVTSEHMEYFRTVQNADRIGESRTESEMRSAVEEIRMEIKKLTSTSKLVERTVKDAGADKTPIKPGKYHLNFFRFVLSLLRDATRKLEDSVSYGAVLSGKKQQSKYWSSYKAHGTSFGLSGERSTATQTG